MQSLLERLEKLKINITPDFSGDFIRSGAQWFRGTGARVGDRDVQFAVFGDFSRSISQSWSSLEGKKLSHAEQEALNEVIEETRQKNRAEQEKAWEEVLPAVQREWEEASELGESPYFTRKGLVGLFGCRLEPHARGPRTLVPARTLDGQLWGYQKIYSEKLSIAGTDKIFREGARKEGCFHLLGEPLEGQPIYFCEGIATAASVQLALGPRACVVSCFDAFNLLHVGRDFRAQYPAHKFVFCADNDQFAAKDGKIYHTGKVKAERVAKEVGNASVVLPRFDAQDLGTRPTDFNDLHKLYGLDEIKAQLADAPATTTQPDKKQTITEKMIAQACLDKYGDDLMRQDKSLFRYNGTHWAELEAWDIDQIKNHINTICNDKLDSKKVNSIYATFFRLVSHVPKEVNLFVPNPRYGNFADGTLTLSRNEENGLYTLHFREHRREDYLTWVVPVNYKTDRTVKNPLWEKLLADVLEGDPDAEGKLRALKQMGGAMLIAAFSQMFFIYGLSGSRKSTIALTLAKLLSSQNVSACDPANMEQFEIEGMIGKLVNMHTDIDDHVPLPRGFMKRFEDDTPIQVNRKGKPVVKAKLPSVHVYCANKLPPNFEGSGKAFRRRVTLIGLNRDLTHAPGAKVVKHYEQLIWAAGTEGLMNWCREGLEDLLNSGGRFFQPTSSLAAVVEWQAERDPVAQFLKSVQEGEVGNTNGQILWFEEGRILPAHLWEVFVEYHELVFQFAPRVTRFAFYAALQAHGVTKVRIKGREHFSGIGYKMPSGAEI